jgi:hypothetical protein
MVTRNAGARLARCGVLLLAALLIALGWSNVGGQGKAQPALAATTGTTVHYASGWNLVAAPTGTVLSGVSGRLLGFGPVSNGYAEMASSGIVGGRAVWAYFAAATDVTMGATAATYTQMLLPPNHFALIGNPSTTETLPIHGADIALSYDLSGGYQPVTQLKVGQGAFVLSRSGGVVSVGAAPSETIAAQLRQAQSGLTDDAANVATFGTVPALASELLTMRDYGAVQGAMDDLRSAFADGLEQENAASMPELTPTQLSSTVAVRESLAQAQSAAAAGNLGAADAAINQAKMSAQASEDEAATIARKQGSSTASTGMLLRYLDTGYTPQSLARYGNLCTATVPALALALAPTDQFGALVVAVLNNQPIPAP